MIVRSRGSIAFLVLAGCFAEAPTVGDGESSGTGTPTSTSAATGPADDTTAAPGDSTVSTSGPVGSGSATGDSGGRDTGPGRCEGGASIGCPCGPDLACLEDGNGQSLCCSMGAEGMGVCVAAGDSACAGAGSSGSGGTESGTGGVPPVCDECLLEAAFNMCTKEYNACAGACADIRDCAQACPRDADPVSCASECCASTVAEESEIDQFNALVACLGMVCGDSDAGIEGPCAGYLFDCSP